MNIVWSIARWVLAFTIGVTASLWIVLGTANITVANREVAKQWLASSGMYDNALASVLQVSSSEGQTNSSLINADILRQALNQTFDASYLRQSSNTVLDATYDWLEGKNRAIVFTIPVQQKAEVFRANLSALIIPKLQALPVCAGKVTTDSNDLTCLPAGINAVDYAAQLTKPSSDNTFLSTPLSEKTLSQGFPDLGWLPSVYSWLRISFWALPLLAFVLGALYVFISSDKLRGLSRLGRQLTLNAAVSLVTGLFLWFASGSIDLSQAVEGGDAQQTQVIAGLVNPLVRTILPDIGRALSVCGGAVVLVGGLIWLGAFLWQRKAKKPPMAIGPKDPPTTPPVIPDDVKPQARPQ
ncbi:MAG TPA: hypothetical protein VM581_04475 [Magnetospirillaceae bacterium]|nr:hypothetical protein [Magnetospirillaceae bacterium]